MEKILITGGSGFIGTNLIAELLKESKVELLSLDIVKPKINDHCVIWKQVDIRDLENLKVEVSKFNPSIVIHLAARTDLNGNDLEDYDSNILGVSNLLEVLKDLKCLDRAIFTSSMYVCVPGYIPRHFEDYKPHTVYGESKVLTEELIKKDRHSYTSLIIRPTSIWGPWFGEPYKNFFDIVLARKYFHMGKKACDKTYGYIDNTIYQLFELMIVPSDKVNKKVFYIGDWPKYNISEWADEIAYFVNIKIPKVSYNLFKVLGWFGDFLKLLGIKFPMTSFRLKNMTTNNVHDLSLIKSIAPDLPISRIEGVKRTVNWIHQINAK